MIDEINEFHIGNMLPNVQPYENADIEEDDEDVIEEYHRDEYYRYDYKGIGIYEALKMSMLLDEWKSLLSSKAFTWLPKPSEYPRDGVSYFTLDGRDMFIKKVLPICKKYINEDDITLTKIKNPINIVYKDKYQIILSNSLLKESDDMMLYNDIRVINFPNSSTDKYLKNDPECSRYLDTLKRDCVGEILVNNNDELVGYVFVYNNTHKDYGFIFNLVVNKRFRGHGYGSLLIKDAINKFKGVDLTVKKDNDIAVNLYKKNGFEIVPDMSTGKEYYMKLNSINESSYYDIPKDSAQWTVNAVNKAKALSDVVGITCIPRISVHPIDYSPYQRIYPHESNIKAPDITRLINENTYIISDLHFTKQTPQYDINMINKLNKIPKNAVVLILGDVGYAKSKDPNQLNILKDYFNRIENKNMYLILGNHDMFPVDFYYSLGFKGVYERIVIDNKKWIFSHQPCDGTDSTYINFHGHIHDNTSYRYVHNIENKINCWEGYCPNSYKTLREWILFDKIRKFNKVYAESVVSDNLVINEACKDIEAARKFVTEVGKLAKKYNANYFIVTDGASGIHNEGNPAVKNARDSQIEWEKKNGFDPDEDWSKDIKESADDTLTGNSTKTSIQLYCASYDERNLESIRPTIWNSDRNTLIIQTIAKMINSHGYNCEFNNDKIIIHYYSDNVSAEVYNLLRKRTIWLYDKIFYKSEISEISPTKYQSTTVVRPDHAKCLGYDDFYDIISGAIIFPKNTNSNLNINPTTECEVENNYLNYVK